MLAGVIYRRLSRNDDAESAYLKALRYYKNASGRGNIFSAITSIAGIYLKRHDYKKALAFLNDNLKNHRYIEYWDDVTITDTYAECYLKLKHYEEAEKYFLKRFRLEKLSGSLTYLSYKRLGFFYIESQQYAKARPFLQERNKALTMRKRSTQYNKSS